MIRLTSTLATALAVAALLAAAPAPANDTVASMGAGGLVLEKTDGITMLSEDLYLSRDEVRVTYRFLNHTDEAIETIVAFPMPDIEPDWMGSVNGPTPDPMRTLPFITRIDGYSVPTQVEQKAMLDGVDVTRRLQRLGLPLIPYFDSLEGPVSELSEAQIAKLVADGLMESNVHDDGSRSSFGLWTLKTTHYWTQTFYPGEEVRIEHLYVPVVGGTTATGVSRPGDHWPEYDSKYCIDEPVRAAVARRQADGLQMRDSWLDYTLVTGANWSGPIGDFRLVVDKGSEDNVVSFCAEGVRRISPTQFEVRHANFTPTRDLNVLIVQGDRYE
ncbi:DUF4424 domain-containing protein [Brevundimonas basaltis]|uniref:DUF4424 domain-containing protein n=1 Tax=Brevundimonas basaltis TaxID=472166 RepID=A0A7W8HVG4_9CAUL|nr:DUF4424 domain-containing protein [Brevundimonas basaltis]MBB5290599.1 hypothetical protein [Brevundimonas basaltis]